MHQFDLADYWFKFVFMYSNNLDLSSCKISLLHFAHENIPLSFP